MTLKIAQSAQYVGNDYWDWSVWLEGGTAELDLIEEVTWHLHPSFTPSVVVSKDRGSGFKMETSGWGTFVIRATARRDDGQEIKLRRSLELYYPDAEEASAPSKDAPPRAGVVEHAPKGKGARAPQVYLSYGSEDRKQADRVRRAVESLGVEVIDPSNIQPGESFEVSIRNMLRESAAMIAVVSSEFPSPFLAEEVNASVLSGKPTLVLVNKDLGRISGLPTDVQVRSVSGSDENAIAGSLNDWLANL